MSLPILGFAEVVLNVHDLPVMRDFYSRALGFVVHSEGAYLSDAEPDSDDDPTICFLTVTHSDTPLGRGKHPPFLALIDFKRHASAKSRGIRGAAPDVSTLNHLAFEIPSDAYADCLARLRQLGLEPSETTFPNLNAKAIFFEDPEGNTLELICPA